MDLTALILDARSRGASDLHLGAGLPPAVRMRGTLKPMGPPLSAAVVKQLAEQVVGAGDRARLLRQRSFDVARTIGGVRCRLNVFHASRGISIAVRLLPAGQPTVTSLNLHPDVAEFARPSHGLVLICGPTGSGKSSTQAALVEEINCSSPVNIITVESPIEFALRPRRALIRQREVGRDTPSFEQALTDALREDPDVIMVGEMREPETMRLVLNAAETGHLVLATLHSANVVEALQRIVLAFPPEIQGNVAAQLAGSLAGVVCQRLIFRAEIDLRVPECEILTPNDAVRSSVRHQEFYKIPSILEAGGRSGMWTFARYRRWVETRDDWARPLPPSAAADEPEAADTDWATLEDAETAEASSRPGLGLDRDPSMVGAPAPDVSSGLHGDAGQTLVIDQPEEELEDILEELRGTERGE